MKVSVSHKRSSSLSLPVKSKSSDAARKLRVAKAIVNVAKNRKRFESIVSESGDLLQRIEGSGLIVGRR